MNKDRVNKSHPRATHLPGASHVLLDPRSSAFVRVLIFLALVIGAVACGRSPQPIVVAVVATVTPAPVPTVGLPSPTPTPRPTPAPSVTPAGWKTIQEGVQIRWSTAFEDDRATHVYALRLDPSRVDVRVRYDPEKPRRVSDWFAAEQPPSLRFGDPRPLAALNAGFFDDDNSPIGVWVVDGVTYGRWHRLMQGEFRVSGAGLSIRRVVERHLTDGTRVIASLESYPLLLLPGGRINPVIRPSSPAERLVVGIDGAGFLVFVLLPSETFTLPGLASWLKRSDLNLDAALNLDGGSSAGMLVQDGGEVWGRDSRRDVPGAIVVLSKVPGAGDGEGDP